MRLLASSPGDDPTREMHPLVTAIFGATAGAASVFGNTPLDVVKTRMQVRPYGIIEHFYDQNESLQPVALLSCKIM